MCGSERQPGNWFCNYTSQQKIQKQLPFSSSAAVLETSTSTVRQLSITPRHVLARNKTNSHISTRPTYKFLERHDWNTVTTTTSRSTTARATGTRSTTASSKTAPTPLRSSTSPRTTTSAPTATAGRATTTKTAAATQEKWGIATSCQFKNRTLLVII